MILERLSLKPLNVIWIETSRITEWGFYLAFYPQGIGVIEQLNEITRNAYQCLCKGNHEAFAKNLADSYRLILSSVQAYMVEKYKFTELYRLKFLEKTTKSGKIRFFRADAICLCCQYTKKRKLKNINLQTSSFLIISMSP